MRIVFLSYLHPDVMPGGSQQVAFDLYEECRRSGQDAYLLCSLENYNKHEYIPENKAFFHFKNGKEFCFKPIEYNSQLISLFDFQSQLSLYLFFKEINPEVIHFHHYHRFGTEAINIARLACPSAKLYITFHEMMAICLANGQMVTAGTRKLCHESSQFSCASCFPELGARFIEIRKRRLLHAFSVCNGYIFPSHFIMNRYIAWGLLSEKCYIIPNGIKSPGRSFSTKHRSRLLNRFGFFGQLLDNKGLDVLLDALLILANEAETRSVAAEIVIEINSANAEHASLSYKQLIRHKLNNLRSHRCINIIDRGSYSQTEISNRMSSVDWIVVPSTWWEVFGLVVSEAWSNGRVVIASDIAGLSERINDGITGLLFDTGNALALARTISKCLGNEPIWNTISSSDKPHYYLPNSYSAHVKLWEINA